MWEIGDVAAIFGLETRFGQLRRIGRNDRVLGVGKRLGMDEGEMCNVNEAFDLPPCKALDVDPGAGDLLERRIIPVRHGGREIGRAHV